MNLTQTAILTKRIIASSIFLIIISIISFASYKIWYFNYLKSLPPVEEKPDMKFGQLPMPDFPKEEVSSSNYSYSLDTVTGSLPTLGVDPGFDKILKIYFITKPYSTLLSSEKGQTLASKFGIDSNPDILSETNYLFKTNTQSLNIDLDSGNFKYINTASPQASLAIESETNLLNNFKNTLKSLGKNITNLEGSRSKISYPDATTAKISLWPANIDNKVIYTPQFDTSLINATIIASSERIENFQELNYTNWDIDQTTFATYYAKNPSQAFEELKSGKGILVVEPKTSNVSITDISIGYFLPENYQPYLQPVYIFSGSDFKAYIWAVENIN